MGFEKARKIDERWYDFGLYLLKGDLLEVQGGTRTEIESCYQQAIEIARTQKAKSFELQGALARVKYSEGSDQLEEQRASLSEILAWFDEGQDSALLDEAKELLNQSNP